MKISALIAVFATIIAVVTIYFIFPLETKKEETIQPDFFPKVEEKIQNDSKDESGSQAQVKETVQKKEKQTSDSIEPKKKEKKGGEREKEVAEKKGKIEFSEPIRPEKAKKKITESVVEKTKKKPVGTVSQKPVTAQPKKQNSKPIKSEKKERSCLKLEKIIIDESEILSPEDQDKITAKYVDKCLASKLIKELLPEISSFYMSNGYVTTKAFLKPQDISDGKIEINVIKGIVEKIAFTDKSVSDWQIKTAFAGQEGEVLNLRNLENALENVNRLPSNDAKINLLPGSKHGNTKVIIENKKSSPLRFSIGITGEESLEDEDPDLTATLQYDNLFDINDILNISINGSKIQEEYKGTNGYEINYSFPIGSWLTELIYSETSYRQEVVGINDNYLSEGTTTGRKVRVNKVLGRNQKNKLDFKTSINHKDTKNYFEEELIEVSSYVTTVLQLDLIHTYLFGSGQLASTYSLFRGVGWFGAATDNDFNEDEADYEDRPKFEFVKWVFDANLSYYITKSTTPWMALSNFHYQYSDDNLHSSEQLSVGNYQSVRGYTTRYLSGNSGWYLKSDLKKSFTLEISDYFLNAISFFIGRDFGEIHCEETTEGTCGTVSGAAFGFSTSGKYFVSDFTWATPTEDIGDDFDDSQVFRYNLLFQF